MNLKTPSANQTIMMNPKFQAPLFFERNRVFRVYEGGKLFHDFFGDEAVDGNFPEEWIASKVKALNKEARSPDEGLSKIRGTGETLAALLADFPGEMLKGFAQARPLPDGLRRGLPPALAARLQWAFPVIPLTGFPALATAFGNDVNPEYVFAQLVLALGRPGDVLGALSTSGNSANVCRAAEVARARNLSVLAMTGATGGKLRELADVCICVPATQTPHIQELHLPIYHCLSLMLEETFIEHWQ